MGLTRGMKARDLVASVKAAIQSGSLAPDAPLQSASALAAAYGVAGITANRALQQLAGEGYVVRRRGSGTFVASTPPSIAPTGIRVGVGLELPVDGSQETMAAFGVVQESIFAELRQQGHVGVVLGREALVEGGLAQCDAVILSPGWLGREQSRLLLEWGRPVVGLTYRREDLPFHQVGVDYRAGFRTLIRHLKGQGHKRFLVAGLHCSTSEERCAALTAMAVLEGFPAEAIVRLFVDGVPGDYGRLSGQQIGRLWLKRKQVLPVISLSDFLSFGIIDVLREHRITVGRDYLLASYDNLEGRGLVPFGDPLLTAITHPLVEVSQEAVRVAGLACSGRPGVLLHHHVEARELVVRQSA